MIMIINVNKDESHKDYKDFTLIGSIANAILNIKIGDRIVIEKVVDIDGEKKSWGNIRIVMNSISKDHNRIYRTKLINDKLLVRAVK
jgi:hypothetical protein